MEKKEGGMFRVWLKKRESDVEEHNESGYLG